MPTSIHNLLKEARARLQTVHETYALDAEVLLAHVLNSSRTHLHTWPEQDVSPEQENSYRELIKERQRGEPVAYLVGYQEFWSMRLRVTPATLIPRPETELLVEESLKRIPEDVDWQILDLGTGSGAIALAIASERPRCRVIGVERARAALQVAEANAKALNIPNVRFVYGDWLAGITPDSCDMIVSNPPYIRDSDPHLKQGDVRFEPNRALASGDDGLDAVRRIATQAEVCLKPGGWLLMEHGYDQADEIAALLASHAYTNINDITDLAKLPRLVVAQSVNA